MQTASSIEWLEYCITPGPQIPRRSGPWLSVQAPACDFQAVCMDSSQLCELTQFDQEPTCLACDEHRDAVQHQLFNKNARTQTSGTKESQDPNDPEVCTRNILCWPGGYYVLSEIIQQTAELLLQQRLLKNIKVQPPEKLPTAISLQQGQVQTQAIRNQ